MDLDRLKWDSAGLVTVVVQDRHTGEIRMVAWASREAIERTLAEGVAWFHSRSRASLWRKGDTSGNLLRVVEVAADCDGDTVLYLADPEGPSCHTGKESCFFQPLGLHAVEERLAAPTLLRLERTLESRRSATAERSYTRSLLEAGPTKIAAKIREEAAELASALESESDERVVSEAADVIYHALVALLARNLRFRDVVGELARRFGVSGHDEKASR